ncbi:hypothetical protein [Gracilimonas sp. BCB1]|uniref:hypothetical protein n=1 Tax=Gracilimonas sp. BCB1 TaxID=3152362 RepID=UPI0032D97DDD
MLYAAHARARERLWELGGGIRIGMRMTEGRSERFTMFTLIKTHNPKPIHPNPATLQIPL